MTRGSIAFFVALFASTGLAETRPSCRDAVQQALDAQPAGSAFLAEGDRHRLVLPPFTGCVGILAVGAREQRVGLEAIDAEGVSVGGDRSAGGFAWIRACDGWHIRLHGLTGAGEVTWAVTAADARWGEQRRSPPEACGPFAQPASADLELGPAPSVPGARWLVGATANMMARGYSEDDRWIAEAGGPQHALNVSVDRCYIVAARGRAGPRYMRVIDESSRELARGRGELRFCPATEMAIVELDALAEPAAVALFSLRRTQPDPSPALAAAYSEFLARGDPSDASLHHLDSRRPLIRRIRWPAGCSQLVAIAEDAIAVRLSSPDGTLLSRDSARASAGGTRATVHWCTEAQADVDVRVSVSEPGLVWVATRTMNAETP